MANGRENWLTKINEGMLADKNWLRKIAKKYCLRKNCERKFANNWRKLAELN